MAPNTIAENNPLVVKGEHLVSALLERLPKSTVPTIAGHAAFSGSLALSTFFQMSMLGASTGSVRPIPTVLGVVSVALASLASHKATVQTHGFLCGRFPSFRDPTIVAAEDDVTEDDDDDDEEEEAPQEMRELSLRIRARPLPVEFKEPPPPAVINFGAFSVPFHALRICVVGLVAFKVLGGRFWGIAPSSYTHLGSFARFSIPATEKYATVAERAALARIGRLWGCHTCGSRMLFRKGILFHGDHMPPKSVADQMNQRFWRRLLGIKVPYRFFPQCVDCSNKQGKLLAMATRELRGVKQWWARPNLAFAGGGRLSHFHGLRFRINHLAGAVIGAATVVGASDNEIQDNGNAQRFQKLQETIEAAIYPLLYRNKENKKTSDESQ